MDEVNKQYRIIKVNNRGSIHYRIQKRDVFFGFVTWDDISNGYFDTNFYFTIKEAEEEIRKLKQGDKIGYSKSVVKYA